MPDPRDLATECVDLWPAVFDLLMWCWRDDQARESFGLDWTEAMCELGGES